jgi:predicted porin
MRKYLLAGAAALAFTGGAQAADMTPGSGGILNSAKPGEVKVRIDAAVWAMAGFGSSTNDKAQVGGVSVKNDSFGMMTTFRLYPQLDAQTAGGLKYGAFAEVRTNSPTSGSASRTTGTLFLNRGYVYVGGDSWGMIRAGEVDGPLGLLQVGTFQNFAMGGLNGFAPGMIAAPDNYIWRFPFSQGGEYTTQKIVYTSPSFAGFDLGVSFAPSTSAAATSDIQNVVTGGSVRQATSALAADANRRRNEFQVNLRYRGTFSGFGIAANVGYMGSSRVTVPGIARRGLSIVDAGLQASYMGFSVGGHVSTGTFNGSLNLSAPGEKNATTWLVGASYTTGPWTAGVHYLNAHRPGTFGNGAMMTESGIGAGLTYRWAPGATAFVEFVHHHRKERGVNFQIGTGPARDNVNGSALIVGQLFRW